MEAVKMVGLRRLIRQRSSLRDSLAEKVHSPVPSQHLARLTPKRFFDLHQLGNKEAIEKERARLADEMTRGYFADMAEFKKHAGKIAVANKLIIPAMVATKFPDFEVSFTDGKTMKLPIRVSDRAVDSDKSSVPKASLVCLSFRASSQEMINSWSVPFTEAFRKSNDVHLYQVSFIDSWLLCRAPIKRLLLWTMKKPSHHESKDTLQQQIVYSFGDHYYFRKELRILNLLTGYIFLLDNFGRVRWQGFGSATQDELSSLLSCTSLLLDQK
ncbi:hypothetical protein AAZX31_13G201800 [Glycine max]|uniref:AT1G08220-like protein n=3 Tax=Glycine subgen. Soja TaxID=1462606 RepID=A0A0R0GS15_SOYBN|nr:uncharacterized protein LOC100793428 isoform X1 [Glycine max]XP_028187502.1 uncharacterized protein LOC114374102 isoform X1 [Glycine soja]KAH1102736.1 hypothetical protein GYH30_036994 [Glycine max]KAH1217769.1 hypothetical protein GmHk_13G038341 [Glycine max]KRH21084.1 hypothetical protein GLYMA_13G219600v4 [Glycine max]RZB82241.1 hypothetical protein D0Y65_031431 [Glycine soja]|eukprot:XP_003542941.1 uncharacterized protein LOC100793428 isoform X1 [Glycine max]